MAAIVSALLQDKIVLRPQKIWVFLRKTFTKPASSTKRRLADEYDAAQERGEIRAHGERSTVLKTKTVGFREAGLNAQDLHEARIIRDAETARRGNVAMGV